ncbi:MAG: hypothetical protein WCA12_21585 [Burkholderiales bacterium]
MDTLKNLLGMFSRHADRSTLLDVLRQTPPEELDATVMRLKKRTQGEDLREAYMQFLGVAPLEHFKTFKEVYMKHFTQ